MPARTHTASAASADAAPARGRPARAGTRLRLRLPAPPRPAPARRLRRRGSGRLDRRGRRDRLLLPVLRRRGSGRLDRRSKRLARLHRVHGCCVAAARLGRCGVFEAELPGARIGTLRESHVDVAEVGVHHGVRPQLQCRDERAPRVVEPAQPAIEHRKVVVRLEHVGVLVAKALEYGDRVDEVSFPRQQDAVKHPHARRVRFTLQQRLERLACFRIAFLSDQCQRIVDLIAGERPRPQKRRRQHPAGKQRPPAPGQGPGHLQPGPACARRAGDLSLRDGAPCLGRGLADTLGWAAGTSSTSTTLSIFGTLQHRRPTPHGPSCRFGPADSALPIRPAPTAAGRAIRMRPAPGKRACRFLRRRLIRYPGAAPSTCATCDGDP